MRLLVLNIWGGKVYQPLMDFVSQRSQDVDIFCFQEVFNTSSDVEESRGIRADIFSRLSGALGEFEGHFASSIDGADFEGPVDFPLSYGLAIFVRKTISVNSSGAVTVFPGRDRGYGHPRIIQFIRFQLDGKNVTLANFHGLVLHPGDPKDDTPERLGQSRAIREFLDKEVGEKILCGDFNILPDVQSMQILETGMKNLIKEYGATSTRTHHYTKPNKYSDYVIVSPDIEVSGFEVLPDVVSDHSPLLLDFS